MGLRLTPVLEDTFRVLLEAGAAGVGDPMVTNLPLFEAHGLAERFEDPSRVCPSRYRLTEIGQRLAGFLYHQSEGTVDA